MSANAGDRDDYAVSGFKPGWQKEADFPFRSMDLDLNKRLAVIEANQSLMHSLLVGGVDENGESTPGLVRRMENLEKIGTTSLTVLKAIGAGIFTIAIAVVTLVAQNVFSVQAATHTVAR